MLREKLALVRDYLTNPHKYADATRHQFDSYEAVLELRPLSQVADMREIGSGSFARVYEFSTNTVLKIAKDENYRAYAAYVQSKNRANPYLPRIYYRSRVGDFDLYVLEKLEPLRSAEWQYDFVQYFEIITALVNNNSPVALNCPHLTELFAEFGPENFTDVSRKNCMLRGEQLVFTDPCSEYYGSPRRRDYARR